jgi:hypothetical protein
MMKYLIPTLLASVPILLASTAFADPCSDAICSLAGHAGSFLGTAGILGLLVAGAVVLACGSIAAATELMAPRRLSELTTRKFDYNGRANDAHLARAQ